MSKKKNSGRPPALKLSSNGEPAKNCECYVIALGVMAAALVIVAIAFLIHKLNEPKFNNGDCVVNRSYNFMQVIEVDTTNETYRFRRMKINQDKWSTSRWYLTPDWKVEDYSYTESYSRDISWADGFYSKIKCDSEL